MLRARALYGGDYLAGYQRGLRRAFHGEAFGTADEHARWLALGEGDDHRHEVGRDYSDGLAAREPTADWERAKTATRVAAELIWNF